MVVIKQKLIRIISLVIVTATIFLISVRLVIFCVAYSQEQKIFSDFQNLQSKQLIILDAFLINYKEHFSLKYSNYGERLNLYKLEEILVNSKSQEIVLRELSKLKIDKNGNYQTTKGKIVVLNISLVSELEGSIYFTFYNNENDFRDNITIGKTNVTRISGK